MAKLNEKKKKSLEDEINSQFKKLQKETTSQFKRLQRETTQMRVQFERSTKDLRGWSEKANSLLKQINERMHCLESFEESFLYILHNIKKNQFLYAHYPDEWVKNYNDLKEGLKVENEHLNKLAQ